MYCLLLEDRKTTVPDEPYKRRPDCPLVYDFSDKQINGLTARIAELEEKQRWRVVANGELPEDGEVVWLWDGKYIGMGYYLVFAGQFMDRDTPLRPIRPSHWMRFPESPEVTE
jgi:hypothetical protein